MARYNPSGDPNFTGVQSGQHQNQEGGFSPDANELYWGGSRTGAQEDVNRYRDQASRAGGRGAYQTNLGGFGESRGVTMGALGGLGKIARGEAPSAAEIQGRQFLDTSLQNQVAAAGSTRGGPANTAAAYRNAATQGAVTRQKGLQDINAQRAQEQHSAYNTLVQGGLGVQGQDLGAAGLQQQSELAQRGLNQQGEQFYEGLGFQTKGAELGAGMGRQELTDRRAAQHREAKLKDEQQEWGKTKDIISTVAGPVMGALGGIFASDPRAKMNVGPVGVPPPTFGPPPPQMPEVPMFSDKDTKREAKAEGYREAQTDLESAMLEGTEGASPYERGNYPEAGVAGAPRGHAAQREGQPGAMDFRPAPSAQGDAPGTKDWERYGAPMDMKAEAPEWRGQPKPPPSTFQRAVAGFTGAFAPQRPVYVQQAPPPGVIPSGMMGKMPTAMAPAGASPTFSGSQGMLSGSPMGELKAHSDFATRFQKNPGSGPVGGGGGMFPSDPNAKREAFQDGVKYADTTKDATTKTALPDYMKDREMKSFQRDTAPDPAVSPVESDYARQRQIALLAAPPRAGAPGPVVRAAPGDITGQPKDRPLLSPPEAKTPVYAGEAEDFAVRDEVNRAELGELQRMRQPKTFKRDTPEERSRERKGIQDKAGREADELMASYRRSLNEGASAAPVFEIEDEKEMAEANRALVPSRYEYKPEYRPPEQHPGEVNVGPMADRMARDDVAGTAVKRLPDGMLALDRDKSLKLALGGLASLQLQLDQMKQKEQRRGRR